ncbi:MAG TPA: hypothetical protein PKN96_11835 [Flavobacterium sp.]|nr:hypothetical protein [Flavobacterium sp.]HNP33973.1 hypothetical protein [Flavobacterium sp.]
MNYKTGFFPYHVTSISANVQVFAKAGNSLIVQPGTNAQLICVVEVMN